MLDGSELVADFHLQNPGIPKPCEKKERNKYIFPDGSICSRGKDPFSWLEENTIYLRQAMGAGPA